ncbi:MAG: VCBS repeat-containing protein [Bacteroidota bacterium]|nr:VCBS repeat-containing protein [Bacteroidota bacterium]
MITLFYTRYINLKKVYILLLLPLVFSCRKQKVLFEQIPSSQSGIHFNNSIIDNDSMNIIDVTNVYNGGGVGVGDFNNDGLQDIYFTGNLVPNKLYLNKGNFKFDDVTAAAGVDGNGRWCRGVAVVDINNDGWMDMYVCCTLKDNPSERKNLLYINQGIDKNKVPHFKEMAHEYGLDDSVHSTMAAFFDYDNDGDLDMYLVVNEINKHRYPDDFHPIMKEGENPSTGKLFRNDWNEKLHHPVFTDVSKEAGIQTEGYGHSVNIVDINNDGWKDIYVTNDFVTNDLLWINNHDGTFSNQLSTYFKHTSANAMGIDIEDINNDGLKDVVVLDMNPEDNFRKKMNLNINKYQNYQNSDAYNYNYQYVRNTLQLNQGNRVGQNDSIGVPIFSEIGFFSGISETDWSWTPMVTDFDNDGYRDIIITNGFAKDVNDHDFMAYRKKAYIIASKRSILDQIPQVKLHNYGYKNNKDLTFTNATEQWGLTLPTFSNGATYADLDNDGDLDIIINNINDEALVYKNNAREQNKDSSHYIQLRFHGNKDNINGLGVLAELYYNHGQKQVWENTPFRGYLTTIDNRALFGLGKTKLIDSIVVKWPGGKEQTVKHIPADQLFKLDFANATDAAHDAPPLLAKHTLFKEVTDSAKVHFIHQQRDFIDFNIQKLLPHKLSEYGPGMAVGDIDGNGLDDIIVGGAFNKTAFIFLQDKNKGFIQKSFMSDTTHLSEKYNEDMGMLLFDADGDGDNDLYVASGGYANAPNSIPYQDRLYINDGKGNFKQDSLALPKNLTSKFCVRAIDYDKDGDLDLFVSGRIDPWNYPKPVSSFILRNDSKNGVVKFTDVTEQVAPELKNIGLVCDALFTDFDNDGWTDLILAGEWMPVTFLKNDHGNFKNITEQTGAEREIGWWNSITAGDFDNDGDIDYIVGNLGLNSFYKASHQYPVSVYAKDFDKDGVFDALPSLYLLPTAESKEKKEYPAQVRDDIIRQMISMRRKFQTYQSFATATMDKVLSKEQLQDALILHANNFNSVYLRNDGKGKFTMMPLPKEAQLSMLNGMCADDYDGDGNLDVLINGNDYGTEVNVGRYDALNGLLLKGDGHGNFTPQTILQSGIFIPGNGKSLVKFRNSNNNYLLAASQNRGPLKIFQLKNFCRNIPLQPNDEYVMIHFRNGAIQKQECYYGNSFLSQSARFVSLSNKVAYIIVHNTQGQDRKIEVQ